VSGPDALVAMRLADMHKVHPQQDNSRVCSSCGAPVGVYPSGQGVLKRFPQLKIICNVCAEKTVDVKRDTNMAAAPMAVIMEEIRQSVPLKREPHG
jgi:hypothetical protein